MGVSQEISNYRFIYYYFIRKAAAAFCSSGIFYGDGTENLQISKAFNIYSEGFELK